MGKKNKEKKEKKRETFAVSDTLGAFLVARTWRCYSVFDVLHEYLPLYMHMLGAMRVDCNSCDRS